eukprot:99500-Rhodomonas_salina.2
MRVSAAHVPSLGPFGVGIIPLSLTHSLRHAHLKPRTDVSTARASSSYTCAWHRAATLFQLVDHTHTQLHCTKIPQSVSIGLMNPPDSASDTSHIPAPASLARARLSHSPSAKNTASVTSPGGAAYSLKLLSAELMMGPAMSVTAVPGSMHRG